MVTGPPVKMGPLVEPVFATMVSQETDKHVLVRIVRVSTLN